MVAPSTVFKKRRPSKTKTVLPPPSPPPPLPPPSPPPPPPPPKLPAIVADLKKREFVVNKLTDQRNSGFLIDREILLQSIRNGITLRKTDTRDKSVLLVDDELISEIKKQPIVPPPCLINTRVFKPLPPPPPPPPVSILPIKADPQKRASVLNKLLASVKTPVIVDRDALIRSIQTGVTLRKTNTNDRSGLFVDDDLISDIKNQPDAPCLFTKYIKPEPFSPPPPPPPIFIIGDPEKRANLLNKFANRSPTPVDRDMLLRSIQTGVSLRKTKINDRSGLVVDEKMKFDLRSRLETPCSQSLLDIYSMTSQDAPKSSTSGSISDLNTKQHAMPTALRGFVKAASAAPTPLPPSTMPPAPPPISANPEKRAFIINKLAARNVSNLRVDRDELFRSIKCGVCLRKTITNDRSKPVVALNDEKDETTLSLKSRPETPTSICSLESHGITETASSSGCETDYCATLSSRHSENMPYVILVNNNADFDNESVISYGSSSAASGLGSSIKTGPARARSTSGRLSTLSVNPPDSSSVNSSITNSPNSNVLSTKSYSTKNLNVRLPEKKKSDFFFDESNLKVTKEDINNEIPTGSARFKIAAFRCFEIEENKSNQLMVSKSVSPAPRRRNASQLAKIFEPKDLNELRQQNGSTTTCKTCNISCRKQSINQKTSQKLSVKDDLAKKEKPKTTTLKNFTKTKRSTKIKANKEEKIPPPIPTSDPPPLQHSTKIILTTDTSKILQKSIAMFNNNENNTDEIGQRILPKVNIGQTNSVGSNFEKIRRSFNSTDQDKSQSDFNLAEKTQKQKKKTQFKVS